MLVSIEASVVYKWSSALNHVYDSGFVVGHGEVGLAVVMGDVSNLDLDGRARQPTSFS